MTRSTTTIRLFVALLALVLVVDLSPLRPVVADPLLRLTAPALIWFRSLGESVVGTATTVRDIPILAKENGQLRAQVTDLQSKLQADAELEHENTILRQELKLDAGRPDLVAAQVINRTGAAIPDELTINRGRDDGITPGMPFLASGYLVGQAKDVTPHTATITVVTASSSLVPIVLQTSRATGLLKGGPSGLYVDEVPKNVSIAVGEGVVTSPLGNAISAGLPVGSVSAVDNTASHIFQTVRVSSPIDFSRLEVVFGLKGS